jgi:CheY-like chemotaxis protein
MSEQLHRILIVEQDDLIRPLAAEWLNAAGYDVDTVAAAEEAGTGHNGVAVPQTDLIVVDLPAPRAGGAATVRLLQRFHPGVPIVATSACFLTGIGGCMDAAGRLGVVGVLAKPYSREQLLSSVQHALADGFTARRG